MTVLDRLRRHRQLLLSAGGLNACRSAHHIVIDSPGIVKANEHYGNLVCSR